MTLWSEEFSGVDFEEVFATRRAAVGALLDVLEATVPLLGGPREALFDSDTLAFVDEGTALLRQFERAGEVPDFDEERFFEAAFLESDSLSPNAGAALRLFFGQVTQFATDQMDWTGVGDGLDACYEIVLQHEALGRIVTVDMERENPRCRRAVEVQKERLARSRAS
ncbi:hypothetical protein ACWC10_24920 [Streptomyces sp. NPDC001595]|uniref:hypothetical protein n=1 Tax=Streptomyces sp. NPDC001532 TaxID=3154520 RepID=UPI0033199CCF